MSVDTSLLRAAPETFAPFRLGQLLLLLATIDSASAGSTSIDRLGYYDFFAANPFLVVEPRTRDGRRLLASGFDYLNLDYQSSSQRFANRRGRLQHDLALLTAYGLIVVGSADGRVGYELTSSGRDAAMSFRALYADAYRASAAVVVGHLRRLSDAKLRVKAAGWLRADSLLIDLYDS
jgi:hypothetical protein